MREFVDDLVPRRYEALTGTLAPAPSSDVGNSQVDLMIVNTLDFPVLVRDGVLAVVLPHSVEIVIEIKTDLDGPSKMRDALRQLQRVHRLFSLEKPPLSILFSYGYPAGNQTLIENLKTALNDPPSEEKELGWRISDLPDCIMASGSNDACIATVVPETPDKVRVTAFRAEPMDTISYLLNRILRQLTPKPQREATGPETQSRDPIALQQMQQQQQAWTWIHGYFDVTLKEPAVEEISLPTPSPPPTLEGDE